MKESPQTLMESAPRVTAKTFLPVTESVAKLWVRNATAKVDGPSDGAAPEWNHPDGTAEEFPAHQQRRGEDGEIRAAGSLYCEYDRHQRHAVRSLFRRTAGTEPVWSQQQSGPGHASCGIEEKGRRTDATAP